MLTLGGPPPMRSEPSRGHSPGKRRGGNGAAVGAGQEGEGEDLSTVVYRKGRIYAAATVCSSFLHAFQALAPVRPNPPSTHPHPHTPQIILNGKLTVTAGRDGFQCEAGPWTVLAAEAVTADYGEYAPGACLCMCVCVDVGLDFSSSLVCVVEPPIDATPSVNHITLTPTPNKQTHNPPT